MEAAETAKKEAQKAKSVKKGGGGAKGKLRGSQNKGREVRRGESQRSQRARERHRESHRRDYSRDYDRDYDRGTVKSTKSGSVAVIIRPVRGRACIERQGLISAEEGLIYSPVASRTSRGQRGQRGQLSPDQAALSRDTQWKYQKVSHSSPC